jgi:hypothetical protein
MEVPTMFSLLKRLSSMPILIGSLAVFGPLTLLFLFNVPDKLARAMGYRGERWTFALDGHPSSPDVTYQLLSDYGEAGRRATVRLHLLLDMLYPVSYTLFFSTCFTLLGSSLSIFPRLWRRAAALPWLVGGCDLLENTGIILMAPSYPSRLSLIARITSVATWLKLRGGILIYLLWLSGGLLWLRQQVEERMRKSFGRA